MILLIIRNESNNKPAKLIHFEVSVVKLEDSVIQIKVIITAAAAGLDAVIIADPKTDLYHPNIIRNSLGGVFSIPVAMGTSHNVISFLKKNNFNIITTALVNKAKHYKRVKYEKPFALVFGSEEKGLDDIWIKIANQLVKIPVKFPIDSLNLSVSAGVLIYHCVES